MRQAAAMPYQLISGAEKEVECSLNEAHMLHSRETSCYIARH